MTISAAGAGWHAHGRLADEADQEGFAFLCALDPIFTLRFEEGSGIAVTVRPTDDHRQFTLHEYTGPPQRAVEQHITFIPGARPHPGDVVRLE
ncbi:hypothetical protein [Paractinoplanes atraurantiacus]|uniref:Uncharacterized protein n=1 Tax=Paractinoplanes atraurantiacus TaxID=1036182 RepID=A0A285JCZ0_9ACTN|nr:hypothetical protein [Actinoplanes atraurantiacus]SNY58128.1 hypothetical protein SAMN05421748_11912 [Actinoplanes atraurantiacus]